MVGDRVMQAGRIKNEGWSVYFDQSYNQVTLIYHIEEDKDRLCGSTCCQKKDVLFTHPSSDVAEMMFNKIRIAHNEYLNSELVKEQRKIIQEMKRVEIEKSRKFTQGMVGVLADGMAEYLI